MPFNLEIKYYNSFWLKQNTSPKVYNSTEFNVGFVKVFPGVPSLNYSDNEFPNFPDSVASNNTAPYSNAWPVDSSSYNSITGSNWIIEESRIRGGFNNTQVELGPKAYLKEDSNSVRYRNSALIYSGILNNRTNINETNVFASGEDITRAIDPHNGSIQFLYAMDNNLTILQENKVSQALIDKDAIYSTEGNQTTAIGTKVIGPVTPYVGDYGISRNPESFASFGFRRYFSDKDRNAILRLSRDGLTEISNYGMKDFFRDELVKISEGQLVFSEALRLSYIPKTGQPAGSPNEIIDQGPNPFDSPSAPVPETPLGAYFVLVQRIPDDALIGSQIQLNLNYSSDPENFITLDCFVVATGVRDGDTIVYTTGRPIPVDGLNLDPYVRFVYNQKDKIEGGFDNYKDNYVLSLQRFTGSKTLDESSDNYNTLAFDESVLGWTTFYSFRPGLIFSMKNNFYSTKNGVLYRHYDADLSRTNTNNFYGVDNASSIEFVFNASPNIQKNFKTINYEGTSGWQVDSFISDLTGSIGVNEVRDTTFSVKSYNEGIYYENAIPYRAGFNRKENRYVANLVNNTIASNEEVVFGQSMTGIKGFFANVKLSTDTTTNVGGVKELFSVGTEIVVSSK
jgi:hypothetical protein